MEVKEKNKREERIEKDWVQIEIYFIIEIVSQKMKLNKDVHWARKTARPKDKATVRHCK